MGKFGLNFFKPTEKFNGNWSILESKSREWEKCTENVGVMIRK